MTAPTFYRLTQHALDQATAMGITANEVREAINTAVVDVPSDQQEGCRLAHDGRMKVVYNPDLQRVITVFWLSHDWTPDRYQQPEQPMSGWINLDARGAERLLQAWGFEKRSEKESTNLWTHPDDPEERIIPFSAPDRSTRSNGKGSYRIAARVCGVNVPTWLKGPTQTALEKMRKARQLAEVAKIGELIDAPMDPLGINQKVAAQKLAAISNEIDFPTPPAELETPVHAMTPVDEKVLAAVLDGLAPMTAREVAGAIGTHAVTARDSLRKLVKAGDLYVVGQQPRVSPGRAPDLFWHSPVAPKPPRKPKENPVPSALATASLMREAVASVALDRDQTHSVDISDKAADAILDLVQDDMTLRGIPAQVTSPTARVFEETEIKWPGGGIVIKDDAGNLYVARALTEEGR